MTAIKNVSGTAFVVAEFRAEENRAVNPLYRDLIVELFLNDKSLYASRLVADSFPQVKDMVKIRTRYFDDTLQKQILARFHQVVILGSGLDTRAARKPAQNVTYFEIDDAATLKLKQTSYDEHGLHVNVKFIPGNYVTDGLIDLLKQNEFDFDLPTFFIWEGNIMYLPLQTAKLILAEIRKSLKRFRLSFDYLTEAVIAKTTGDVGITSLVESFENMGAPWLSGISDIESFASELTLKVIENFKTAELYKKYWTGRPMTSAIFDNYSVCTLEG
jgi:methyltransferase (TIGR00027 family)